LFFLDYNIPSNNRELQQSLFRRIQELGL